jgi:hypothetical protein
MSTRLLLSGTLATAAVRRHRKANGVIFGVRIKDTDRGQVRFWTVYINDPDLIACFEEIRVGEPIAVSGPFYVTGERELEHRISAEALLDTKRRKKSKAAISRERRVESDELELASSGDPDDPLPF